MRCLTLGFCAAAFILLVRLAAPVAACPNEKVKVTLVVILASEEGDFVDKRLKWIAKQIREKNPNFKSFKLKTMTCKSLTADEKAMFALVDDKSAQVVVKHGADKHNRVSLAVTAPDQGEIVYRTVCGKFLPIVTRYQTKAKERLILAVQVQPCNDKD
ncbi:MAG: hypothetical protein L0Y71_05565 [Gemmataceae bacterium]|nr:hypothetical protein [Gemmataceae bacterium]